MNRSLDIGIVRGNRRPSDDVPPRQSLKKNKMEPVISRALRRAHYFTSDISPEAIRVYIYIYIYSSITKIMRICQQHKKHLGRN